MKSYVRRRDADALLDGEPIEGDSGLEDVEAFLADVRLEFGAMPAPAPRPTLAATLDGRRELRPASNPGPKPKLTFPDRQPRPRRLRPVVAVFATGAVLFGGLASAGALPGPAQRVTAELGSHLGIDLPGATTSGTDDDGTSGTSRTTSPAATPTSRPGTSPTTAPARGTDPTPADPPPAVVPTVPIAPPSTPPSTLAGVAPTLPTPTLPEPEPPALPTTQNPLAELLGRLLSGLLSP